jgi:glucan phosphoethanolaminetransferase (alkaline phosphatase superfamily)
MSVETSSTARADKFRQAALVYVGGGILVIVLTLAVGTSPQRGTPPLIGLFIGAAFVALFGVLIYAYGWVRQRWAQRIIAVLTGLFVVTNTLRTLQYFINFLGYRLEINLTTLSLAVHPSEFSFPIIFLLCALLMACITFMLARAAWDL